MEFRRTFVVKISSDAVWRAFESRRAEAATGDPRADAARWWLPGFESPATELDVEPGRVLAVRKAAQPCEGTEIVITLESVETGTRVSVVQSGFPALFEKALDVLELGGSQIIADLILYLERGVVAGRHLRPWASLSCSVREVATGLEVGDVQPGGFAARAGLVPGDLLLSLGGAPVFSLRELAALLRLLPSGAKVEAELVRGRERLVVAAEL